MNNKFESKSSERISGCIVLTIALLCLASSLISAKVVSQALPISIAISVRLAISLLFSFTLMRWQISKLQLLPAKIWKISLLQAAIGVVLFNYSLFWGLDLVTAVTAGVIFSSVPVIVALISCIAFHERISLKIIIAAALVGLGVLEIHSTCGPQTSGTSVDLFGAGLIAAAAVCSAVFTVIGKKMTCHSTPAQTVAAVSLSGLFVLAPQTIFDFSTTALSPINVETFFAVIWWAISGGAAYAILMYWALARVDATTAGTFSAGLPLFTLVFSTIILGESIEIDHAVGASFVVVGILISASRLSVVSPSRFLAMISARCERLRQNNHADIGGHS